MTFLEIETAVVEHLKTAITQGAVIEAFPSDVDQYDHLGAQGCILVRVQGDSAEDEVGRDRLQKREVHVVVAVGSRGLRQGKAGHAGCYELMDMVRPALRGFAINRTLPDRAGLPFTYKGSEFTRYDRDKGIWWYAMLYVGKGIDPTY